MIKTSIWIGGGFLVFLFGVLIVIGFFSYFIVIPLLGDMSNIYGLIIAFVGLLMMGYGFKKRSQGLPSNPQLNR